MQRHRLVVSIFVRVFECLYRVKSLIPTALAGKLKQSVVVAVYPSVRLSVMFNLNRRAAHIQRNSTGAACDGASVHFRPSIRTGIIVMCYSDMCLSGL